jgi:hypothetical protein
VDSGRDCAAAAASAGACPSAPPPTTPEYTPISGSSIQGRMRGHGTHDAGSGNERAPVWRLWHRSIRGVSPRCRRRSSARPPSAAALLTSAQVALPPMSERGLPSAVERIIEWTPDHRLAFFGLNDVPTVHELSPYHHVHAPHVVGYFATTAATAGVNFSENSAVRMPAPTQPRPGRVITERRGVLAASLSSQCTPRSCDPSPFRLESRSGSGNQPRCGLLTLRQQAL